MATACAAVDDVTALYALIFQIACDAMYPVLLLDAIDVILVILLRSFLMQYVFIRKRRAIILRFTTALVPIHQKKRWLV